MLESVFQESPALLPTGLVDLGKWKFNSPWGQRHDSAANVQPLYKALDPHEEMTIASCHLTSIDMQG